MSEKFNFFLIEEVLRGLVLRKEFEIKIIYPKVLILIKRTFRLEVRIQVNVGPPIRPHAEKGYLGYFYIKSLFKLAF